MKRLIVLFGFLAIAALLVGSVSAAPVPATDKTYTLDADFDLGLLNSVNHDPTHDQLLLDKTIKTFPFVNIAASGRGTAIRIHVETGAITGEYLTAPNGMGRNPSRTTVDKKGNVWVANRAEFSGGKGSVSRIGLITGGTRSNADGTPNPIGQYLKGPFDYNTCVDRNNDTLIKTSRGLGNFLPWTNAGSADSNGGVSTAEDECIINYTRVIGTGTRTVAIDKNNDVWVGGLGDRDHEKLDGVTGQPVPNTQFNFGCGGYGGLVDRNGVLWSARELLRFVPNLTPPPAGSGTCFGNTRGDYGLGVDPNTGHVWHSSLFSSGLRLYELDAAGNVVNSYPQPFPAQGVVVDGNSHVWMAEIFGSRVWHLAPDPANPSQHLSVGIVPGFQGVTGVAVDKNGKIWGAEIQGNRASRIDPTAGPIGGGGYTVGAIDLSIGLGPNASPYNYSDMTGFVVANVTSPEGTWTVIQDGGVVGTTWGKITWNTEPQASEPAGTSITVEARAADTEAGLPLQPFVSVSNGILFSLTGRYIEVRATLKANAAGDSPILSDIRIQTANKPPDCATAAPSISTLWPPNHRFVPVPVLGITDPDGDPVAITITGIWQDEPVDTYGDGRFTPDGRGVGTSTAEVRAERVGRPQVPGNGRVYHILFTASDGKGGSCSSTVRVGVPHDMRGASAIDDGPVYDSTATAP